MTVCRTTFDGVPANVAWARRFVAGALRIAPGITVPESVVEAAELLTSELAANALLHTRSGDAGQTFGVRVRIDDRGALVEIRTQPPRRRDAVPQVRAAHPWTESGRGLFLVEHLATDWGTLAPLEEGMFFTLHWEPAPTDVPTRTALPR